MNMHDRQCHNIKHSASLWFFHAYSVALPLNNSGDCNSCRLCRHLVNGYDLRILAIDHWRVGSFLSRSASRVN